MHESALETALRVSAHSGRKAVGDCLDDDTSARFAAGEMTPAERAGACEHLSNCSVCLGRIAMLVELEREEAAQTVSPAPTSDHAAPRRALWIRQRPVLALAASLIFTGFIGLLAAQLTGVTRPDYRQVRSSSAQVGVPALRTPADGSEIRRDDLSFEWTGLDAGISYEVELLSSAGDMLWQDRVDGTVAAPPLTLYLEPGATFYVWVRAQLNDGKTVKSPTVSFRVLREH